MLPLPPLYTLKAHPIIQDCTPLIFLCPGTRHCCPSDFKTSPGENLQGNRAFIFAVRINPDPAGRHPSRRNACHATGCHATGCHQSCGHSTNRHQAGSAHDPSRGRKVLDIKTKKSVQAKLSFVMALSLRPPATSTEFMRHPSRRLENTRSR